MVQQVKRLVRRLVRNRHRTPGWDRADAPFAALGRSSSRHALTGRGPALTSGAGVASAFPISGDLGPSSLV